MSAAILQGVPATTLDTDLWIDLPSRQYMLSDGSMVNFLYIVNGLLSFGREYKRGSRLKWLGTEVAVLPLARIYQSKKYVSRPKDLAHLPLLAQTMSLRRRTRTRV